MTETYRCVRTYFVRELCARLQNQPGGTRVFGNVQNCTWAVLSALPVSGRALRICFGDPFEAALRRNNHGKR